MTTSTHPVTTTKLSDTQLTILSAASQREDRTVILPELLTGGAADKVADALARKGLIEPATASTGMPVRRESEDGQHVALRVTDAGLQAIGIHPEPEGGEAAPAAETSVPTSSRTTSPDAVPSRPRRPRTGTKQELLIGLLSRPEGGTVPEVMEATGWLAHTVRGAMAGALK